ncbi:MAG: hypothetical protein CVT92_02635 [Bacteroidetes bacterium HGW-Bacteroidetes-1]|jgi:hypothetical protein|nr:MAG: hypothetical protein CVT92_02635 [Bacteroidetes bacterium HGW-Bacteroidetes-1]
MDNVRRALKKELYLTKIHNSKGLEEALNELCYSAEETGFLSFRIESEEAILIWKLVEIAKKYRTKLPKQLKM